MADYDWFSPTQQELEEKAQENQFMSNQKVGTIHISTAVPTGLYCCDLCGAVLAHHHVYVMRHRERCYEVEEAQGKHRL